MPHSKNSELARGPHENAVHGQPSQDRPNEIAIDRVQWPASRIRTLDARHVLDLAESISVLGLMQPPVVDRECLLIAGGHRYAALKLLTRRSVDDALTYWETLTRTQAERAPKDAPQRVAALDLSRFSSGRIPVTMLGYAVREAPEHAIALEVAENEKRRNYTPAEARAIAERLRAAGFRDANGRPGKGERALRPALALILGKSTRAVRRILGDETRTVVRVSPDGGVHDLIEARAVSLRRSIEGFLAMARGHISVDFEDNLQHSLRHIDELSK